MDHLKLYSDALTEAICEAVEALAVALGETNADRRRVALADAARWTAAAQAAHDAAQNVQGPSRDEQTQ